MRHANPLRPLLGKAHKNQNPCKGPHRSESTTWLPKSRAFARALASQRTRCQSDAIPDYRHSAPRPIRLDRKSPDLSQTAPGPIRLERHPQNLTRMTTAVVKIPSVIVIKQPQFNTFCRIDHRLWPRCHVRLAADSGCASSDPPSWSRSRGEPAYDWGIRISALTQGKGRGCRERAPQARLSYITYTLV